MTRLDSSLAGIPPPQGQEPLRLNNYIPIPALHALWTLAIFWLLLISFSHILYKY